MALLAIMVAGNLVALLLPGALPALLIQVLVRQDRTPVMLVTGLDGFLRAAVPTGNVFLRFRGFSPAQAAPPPEELGRPATACLIYVRTVYALYPRRVYVGPEELPVILGTEFMDQGFEPDWAWLCARDIRQVLTFTRDAAGNIYQQVVPVSAGPSGS